MLYTYRSTQDYSIVGLNADTIPITPIYWLKLGKVEEESLAFLRERILVGKIRAKLQTF